MTNYHAYTTRKLPCFIYWGGAEGYSESRRTGLPGESTLALTVADLNQDGWMDIVPFNHLRDGGPRSRHQHLLGVRPRGFPSPGATGSRPSGPISASATTSATSITGDWKRNIVRPLLNIPAGKRPSRLDWRARTPHGTAVKFQLRSGTTPGALRNAAWEGPGGPGSYYRQPSELPSPSPGHRWLQYRALLTTPDGGSTPVLEEVTLQVSDG